MDNSISNLGAFTTNGAFTLHEHVTGGMTVTGAVSTSNAGPIDISNEIGPFRSAVAARFLARA